LSKAEQLLNDPRIKRTKVPQSYSISNVNKAKMMHNNILNISQMDQSIKENTPYGDKHLLKRNVKKKEYRS